MHCNQNFKYLWLYLAKLSLDSFFGAGHNLNLRLLRS
jgi:hypothetical protein